MRLISPARARQSFAVALEGIATFTARRHSRQCGCRATHTGDSVNYRRTKDMGIYIVYTYS